MDQLTSDKKARDVLKQMETYQFNMPLKVSLILDHSNSDDKISNHGTFNVGNQDSTLSDMRKIVSTDISPFNYNCNDSMKIINKHQPLLHTKVKARKASLLAQLDTLSIDLIRIIEFKKDTSTNYNYDDKVRAKARDNYIRFKVNIFNKLYDVASSVIVPLENTNTFMNTFINRTLALAQGRSSCAISEEMIKNILSDLILWTQLNTSKNVTHRESHCIHRNLSHQSKAKSAYVNPPTYKRHLFDKAVTEGEGGSLKRQKIMRTYSENNFADFNYVRVSQNEISSQKRNNLGIDPTVYLNAESGANAINSPSCINELYDEMVCIAQNGSEIITSSEKNHNITNNNPNIFVENCSVCENFATYMCLGCEKIYYCSLNCQYSEWPAHKYLCKRYRTASM